MTKSERDLLIHTASAVNIILWDLFKSQVLKCPACIELRVKSSHSFCYKHSLYFSELRALTSDLEYLQNKENEKEKEKKNG